MSSYVGQHETAILVAKEAMKHVPDEPSIYYGLGNVLGKEGRYEVILVEIFFRKYN